MHLLKTEKYKHKKAYKYYLELGPERTYRLVAEAFKTTITSVQKWALSFNWRQRVIEASDYVRGMDSSLSNPVPTINEVEGQTQVRGVVNQISKVIEGCFIVNEEGKLVPTFDIRHAKDFLDLVNAEKELIKLYIELAGKDEDGKSRAENEMKKQLGKMTDEQKIELLSSRPKDIEEGYTEQADSETGKDSNGSDAVPESDEPASSGDES